MGRNKSADMTQILMVCAIGMITLFAGLIVWGVIDAFLTPDVTVGEPVIKNVTPSAGGNQYEVVVSVKNEEKKNARIFLSAQIGFKAYRMRHSTSPKPNFYRVFQAIGKKEDEIVLKPKAAQEFISFVDVGKDANVKYEIKPETEIIPKVTIVKTEWKKN